MKQINRKVVVFCDEGEEDWEYFHSQFKHHNLEFTNVDVYDSPDAFEQSFQTLMFDWGGMSMGNSLLESFTRQLYKLAEDNPNKDFVLLSTFSEWAYNDLKEYDNFKHLSNIYTLEQYAEEFK